MVSGVGILAVVAVILLVTNKKESRQNASEAAAAPARSSSFFGFNKSSGAQELYNTATDLESQNEFLKAKEAYQKILSDYPDYKDIANAQKKLEDLNMRIIFSAIQTPQTTVREVAPSESLAKIARENNTTVEFLKKSNQLLGDTIRVGQKLRIWKSVFSVLVDKSQNTLMLKSDNEIIKVYRVSTGTNNITPVGTFKIVNKLIDPPWFKNGKAIPSGSPENILGTRWMGFDIAGYGIHGTTHPEAIGQQVTAGCVRMRNEEVQELYSILPVGTQVTITD